MDASRVVRFADPSRCPDCSTPVAGRDVCAGCDLVLVGPPAVRLFGLLSEADAVLAAMERRPATAGSVAGTETEIEQREAHGAAHGAGVGAGAGLVLPGSSDASAADGPRRRGGLPSLTVPVVLLGIGAVLVSVAVLVFAAFTWFLLPDLGRGLLLLAVAGAAAAGATTTTRRGLPVAAEVLWPLALLVAYVGLVVLGPGDGTAGGAWQVVSALTLTCVAVGAVPALRRRGLSPATSLELSALGLLLLATYEWFWLDPELPVALLNLPVLVPLAVYVGLGLLALLLRLRYVAVGAAVLGTLSWIGLVAVGADRLRERGLPALDPSRYLDMVVAVVLALSVAWGATRLVERLRAGEDLGTDLHLAATVCAVAAAAAASTATLLAVRGVGGYDTTDATTMANPNAAALVLAVVLLLLARLGDPVAARPDQPASGWRRGVSWAWVGATGVALAALVVTATNLAYQTAWAAPGALSSAVRSPGEQPTLWAAPLLLLAAVAATVLRAPRMRSALVLATPPTVLASVALHVAAPTGTVLLVVVVAGLGAVVATAALHALLTGRLARAASDPLATYAAAGSLVAALVTALAAASGTRWPLVGALVLTALLAAVLSLSPTRSPAPAHAPRPWETAAGAATGVRLVAAGVVPVSLALAAGITTASTVRPWPSVTAVAAAGGWLLLLTVLRRDVLARAAAASGGLLVVLGAAVDQSSAADAAWVLLAGGVVAVLTTLAAPEEDGPSWIGSALLLLATLLRLAAGEPTPEVVSLSAGAVLVVIALWQLRLRPGASSLRLLSPGLTLALLPSLLLALEEPVSLRGALLLVLAAAAVAAGAAAGYSAPLLAGAGCLALLAVRMLGPVNSVLPFWVLPGVIGTAMILLGVTWEARRAEIGAATRYVRSLR